jgi:hypothetical protein
LGPPQPDSATAARIVGQILFIGKSLFEYFCEFFFEVFAAQVLRYDFTFG